MQNKSSAFTLVELLVVIAIIAVLTSLVIAGTGAASEAARKTREIAAARSVVGAFLLHATENDDLLAGYEAGAEVQFPNGDIGSGPKAERYPWRLASYLNWRIENTYLINDTKKAVAGQEPDSSTYRYSVSLLPALGMNAYCLGGYRSASGILAKNDVATRLIQVSQPSRMIAFVSARQRVNAGAKSVNVEGSFFVRPPGMSPVWKTTSFDETKPSSEFGNVHPRYNGKAVTAFVDGHVNLLTLDELRDMRLWCKNATTPNYTFRP